MYHSVQYLLLFLLDFRKRFVSLLSYQFRAFTPAMALNILQQKQFKKKHKGKVHGLHCQIMQGSHTDFLILIKSVVTKH